ncbi:SitI3 family protein [Plantactinospora sonchi]|uniref:SitI3 family protein n=1 Tax=Plantactinospora sonchi TaxID=1544735 RepID=A0ABU7S0I8_9ACTN
MAVEYRLTLAGDIPLEEVASLAAPEAIETPASPGRSRVLTADLYERNGYAISVYGGRHGYYDAERDDGSHWEWEPEAYVNVGFRMGKDEPRDDATPNMVATVARILAARKEDAAFVLNGNWLLLTRVDGALRKHRPTWWHNYGVDELVAGWQV